jgi:O-antigen/teichoic acid export membrane protein
VSRSRRAAWTFTLSLAATASGVVAALITTPLLLRYLGDDRVGAYRVAAEWIAYLALFDFGIVGALQVAFSKAMGTGDRAGVAAAVRAGMRAGLLLAGLAALFGLGLAFAAPHLLRGMSAELAAELRFGLLVALIAVLFTPLVAFRPLAEAGQRGYVVQIAVMAQSWLTAGLAIGLAAAGAGLPGQFLAVAIGNGAASLILLRDALKNYPGLLSSAVPTAALPVALSGSMFAFNLLSRIGLHSDAIIIGLTLGPAAVVAFVVTQRLLLLADLQVMALGSAAWAALAELYHQGQGDQFNHRLTQLTRWTGVFAFALLVPTVAAAQLFVELWVGAERFGGHLLVVATATYVWVHTLSALWGWPLVTTGRVRAVLPIYFLGIPLNVAISIAGAIHIGVAGPALGSAIGTAAVWMWWLPLLLRRTFDTPLRPLARAAAGPALLGLPLIAATFFLFKSLPMDWWGLPVWSRWFALGGLMMAAATIYGVPAWFLVLPREDRVEIRARVFRR